eukprot:7439966-Alexandrium_andersonii.AAC.1
MPPAALGYEPGLSSPRRLALGSGRSASGFAQMASAYTAINKHTDIAACAHYTLRARACPGMRCAL